MDFPEVSEDVIAQWLRMYIRGTLPPHAQATLNMMQYARWAKFKIMRQKDLISDYKRSVNTLSVRVTKLRKEIDELKNPA